MAEDLRQLRVWRDAMGLAEKVRAATGRFPADECSGLTMQLRRAAVSVPSCIAEGNARRSTRDYLRFLSMSAGSLAEIETRMLPAARSGYLEEGALASLLAPRHAVARQWQALKNAPSKKPAPNPMFPVPRSPFPGP